MEMQQTPEARVFKERGVLALPGLIPRKLAGQARDSILSELQRLNLKGNGKIFSSKIQNLPIFQQTDRLSQMVGFKPEVDRLFSDELLTLINTLAEDKLKPSQAHSQILLSLPHKTDWSLKNLNWHLDLKVPKVDQAPGIQAFILVDDVQPQGGATLALAGSHRLHYTSHGQNAHGVLKKNADFTLSPEKFLEPQIIDGIPTQIVEMSGRAGDVYLMDLRVLHSPSINTKNNIRMMATNRFLRL